MKCAPVLELKAVKVGLDIFHCGPRLVTKQMALPPGNISPTQVSPDDLLHCVQNVEGFVCCQFSGTLASSIGELFQPARKRKGPLVWADGNEQCRVTILTESIHKETVLPALVLGTEGLALQSPCRGEMAYGGRTYCAGYSVE